MHELPSDFLAAAARARAARQPVDVQKYPWRDGSRLLATFDDAQQAWARARAQGLDVFVDSLGKERVSKADAERIEREAPHEDVGDPPAARTPHSERRQVPRSVPTTAAAAAIAPPEKEKPTMNIPRSTGLFHYDSDGRASRPIVIDEARRRRLRGLGLTEQQFLRCAPGNFSLSNVPPGGGKTAAAPIDSSRPPMSDERARRLRSFGVDPSKAHELAPGRFCLGDTDPSGRQGAGR